MWNYVSLEASRWREKVLKKCVKRKHLFFKIGHVFCGGVCISSTHKIKYEAFAKSNISAILDSKKKPKAMKPYNFGSSTLITNNNVSLSGVWNHAAKVGCKIEFYNFVLYFPARINLFSVLGTRVQKHAFYKGFLTVKF